MKKKLLALFLVAAMIFGLTACGKTSSQTGTTADNGTTAASEDGTTADAQTNPAKVEGCDFNIASLKGPTSIGLVKLFSDSDAGNTVNKYNYSIYGTADEISTGMVKGDLDVAAVPCNLASV